MAYSANISGGNNKLTKPDGQNFTINFWGQAQRFADGTIKRNQMNMRHHNVVSIKVVQDCFETYVPFEFFRNRWYVVAKLNQSKLNLELGKFRLIIVLENCRGKKPRKEVYEVELMNMCTPKPKRKGGKK